MTFYSEFGRPLAKVIIIALGTFQGLKYLSQTLLKDSEALDEKQSHNGNTGA